jgi:transmembrane sensor
MSPQRQKTPIADRLIDAVSEDELAAAWRGVERGSARRARRRAQLRVGVTALLIAGVGAGGYALMRGDGGPREASDRMAALTRDDGSAFEGIGPSERVRLSDRSRIEARDGSLEVLENAPSSLALHLQRGRARFEVTPGTGRRWRVEAAGVSVDVVGTVFTVHRTVEAIQVTVERGVVVVRGVRVPDGVRRLTAGGSLRVALEPAHDLATDDSVAAPTPEPELAASAVGASEPERPAASAEPHRPPARVLLEAADVARRAGRSEEAIVALTDLVRTHPRSREAPLAAFTAARLLRESGRRGEAATWYGRALTLGLPAPLDEQAREALRGLEDAHE